MPQAAAILVKSNQPLFTHDEYYKLLSDIVISKNGKMLSDSYKGSETKLTIQCMAGHIWHSKPFAIRNGQWCKQCYIDNHADKHRHYSELDALAKAYGGRIVSEEYVASSVKMKFECIDGHQWEARPNDVKRGTWCPLCRSNKSENLVRSFFEFAFGCKFAAASPEWLTSEKFPKMVLDGLSTDLSIAFEYHGEQHFNYIPHFHDRNGSKSFEEQQERDRIVRDLCAENNIHLVEIHYLPDGYSQSDFLNHMQQIFKKEFNKEFSQEEIDKFCEKPFMSSKLNEMKDVAKKLGGDCLSSKYMGIHTKHQWICKEGHQWESIYGSVKKGHWCPYCGGRNRAGDTLKEIKDIAKEKGGKLLSKVYTNLADKYQFVCHRGHKFQRSAGSVLYNKQWCQECYNDRRFYSILDKANSMGITLNQSEYENQNSVLTFKCNKNHTWKSNTNKYNKRPWIFICNECGS